MSATVKISKRRSFSAIPDDILTNTGLSAGARLALAYLIGRPEGWVVYVLQVQRALGFSEARWARARKELEDAGYFTQKKLKNAAGRWVWQNIVSDTSTIPSKSMDGLPMDGKPIHGKQADIPKDFKQADLSIEHHHHQPQTALEVVVEFPPNINPKTLPALLAQLRQLPSGDRQAMVDDWAGWIHTQAAAGKPVRNPVGVLRTMVARYSAGGWVPESAHIGAALRLSHRQSQQPPPSASKPNIDPAAVAAGKEFLARLRAKK